MKPKLSIIIVNWNTAKLLTSCLKSLEFEIQNLKFEVIVVDNGSTDESLKVVNNFKVKLIKNKKNLGFAKGNNIGIKQAKGEYIMLLNSDTVVKQGAIETLVNFLEKNPKTAISPLLLLPDGSKQNDYYMRLPNLWQVFLYHNRFLRPLTMRFALNKLIVQKPKKEPFEVDQLPGTALLASSLVWQKVGLLDEDFNFFFEDVDWCWRAKKAGVKRMVVPQSEITHVGGASWQKRKKENKTKFYYQFFSSMLLFVRKNYPLKAHFFFKWAIMLNFVLSLKMKLAWTFFKNNGKQLTFLS